MPENCHHCGQPHITATSDTTGCCAGERADKGYGPTLPAIKALIEAKEAAEKALVLIGEKAMVDFDDETVGQVDAVVKNRERYEDWLKDVLTTYKEASAQEENFRQWNRELRSQVWGATKDAAEEITRLRQWVSDLQSGMFINCVYCGHRYGPKTDTSVAMADVLKAHIVECPKHPLSIVTKALSSLVATKRLKEVSGKTPEYEKARDEAWKVAEAVLKVVLP